MAHSNEVLIDTNMFAVPTQFKIDIISEIKRLVPGAKLATLSGVIRELRQLKEGKIAMKIIEDNNMKIIESTGHVDDAIVDYANDNKSIIATNDIMLIKRLKEIGTPIVRVRKKQTLALEGHISGGE